MVSCATLGLEGVSKPIKCIPCNLRQLWRKACYSEGSTMLSPSTPGSWKTFPSIEYKLETSSQKAKSTTHFVLLVLKWGL